MSQNKQDFSITEDRRDGEVGYFTLKGRVGGNEAAYVERAFEKAVLSGCRSIIVNMGLVNFFSSAGIRVILGTYKKLKSGGGELRIENPSDNVKNVLGMTALDELLIQ